MGSTAEALTKYVDFVSDQTSVPFLVDSISREAKLQAFAHVHEVGVDRQSHLQFH